MSTLALGQHSLLVEGRGILSRGYFGQGVKSITDFFVVPRLRMSGAMAPGTGTALALPLLLCDEGSDCFSSLLYFCILSHHIALRTVLLKYNECVIQYQFIFRNYFGTVPRGQISVCVLYCMMKHE